VVLHSVSIVLTALISTTGFIFPAGNFSRPSAGQKLAIHAQAKIALDFAWWQRPPGDFTKGKYSADFALCDGPCAKWFKKPVILAEQTKTLDVIPGNR
jgi:hypothetical protein